MIRVCTLYSGSSANSTYIEVDGHSILIDAGAGIRKTASALSALNRDFSSLEAVFITHEHSDHISGLNTILKKHRIPLIANEKTLRAMCRACSVADESLLRIMPTGAIANRGVFSVQSFETSHDAAESAGYIVTVGDTKIGLATDLGEVTPTVRQALEGCKILILEANHDTEMLRNGPYPYMLKQRIGGPCGHLSNRQCGELLTELVFRGTKYVLLAHLSEQNNTPELCHRSVTAQLRGNGICVGTDVEVHIAPRNEISHIYTLE